MTPLFAYGTLLRDDWRRAILGGDYAPQPATLRGWRRRVTTTGYLTIEHTGAAADAIDGAVFALDEHALQRADAWEDVPVYRRVALTVTTARGEVEAETYVCDLVDEVAQPGAFAALDDAAVANQIAAFVASLAF